MLSAVPGAAAGCRGARLDVNDAQAVEALITRERKFDSDLWLVEIEVEDLGTYLTLADVAG